MKIGIISPSEIAFRRFLPALMKHGKFTYAGVAVPSAQDWNGEDTKADTAFNSIHTREYEKAIGFKENYGGEIFEGYSALINNPEIEALYIPLPPALHYTWAKKAMLAGKHVFIEKPSTCSLADSTELVEIAREKGLALHENYMFIYHKQIEDVNEIVKSGRLGEVRNYRINFGFPMRSQNDFRYNKALGGGALFDAGGYTLKYARHLLGPTARIISSHLVYTPEFNVDIFGCATLANNDGTSVQVAFGMDNDYRCVIDVWGSKASLTSDRILTAPAGFSPSCTIKTNQEYEDRALSADDTFTKSIEVFEKCIADEETRLKEYDEIIAQATAVNDFISQLD
ncbi:Gfo/Idh/MocA family oxidoreductase [Muribaculaceae bacterium Isolate-002 (NCI)]|nr:Gfo/Idh/MocA family oxidoreductase [Muribaculaceae bacterium Isolate-002 (NCI)]